MVEKVLIVKYGEIAIRGNNRHIFTNKLIKAIRKNIDTEGNFYIQKEQGRLIIESKNKYFDFEKIIEKVKPIFGIIAICPAIKIENQNIENLKQIALEQMKESFNDKNYTFKVETKRSDKRYPISSREVSSAIGGYILENLNNLKVDVHKPEIILNIELRNNAYIYSKIIKTFGGLPIGSSGKAISLLSGGIDSPVATWSIAKRGVEIEAVYFHSPPYTSERAKEKVCDLAKQLSYFTGNIRLHIVPFTDLQIYLLENVPHDKLTIFLKRAMIKIAEIIAKKENAQGLVTGDSIGQVASQTMQALNAINTITNMPILRPLAGMDKQEIIDMAKNIGTFDISIRPYDDCCTIFVAKHPETKPKTSVIENIENNLSNLSNLIEKCIQNKEILEY